MKRANHFPKMQSLLIVVQALRNHIPAEELGMEMKRSLSSQAPYLCYRAQTGNLPWQVDIYKGHFYRAQVGTEIGDVLRSMPGLVGYLKLKLGVQG